MKHLTVVFAFLTISIYSFAQITFTVNSIGDGGDSQLADDICNDGSGNCTLRAAIEQANATTGSDNIYFNIGGIGPHKITPATALPLIVDQVVIDGTTDPDFNGTPIIELDGSQTSGANGLWISVNADNSIIRGLVINAFVDEAGIHLGASNSHIIEGNYIGTDVTGSLSVPNNLGVWILNNSSSNTIGGTSAGSGNLISGNGESGIKVETGSINNLIQGNIIGLNSDGDLIIPNTIDGIQIYSSDNIIGGSEDGARNFISGNTFSGVAMFELATGNVVQGNYLGTDITGLIDLGNNTMGVFIVGSENQIGGTESGEGNVISGNNQNGIWILGEGQGNVIEGNFIGIDVIGDTSLPNTNDGILIENSANI